jgi:RNA polymerase primary sigma factor
MHQYSQPSYTIASQEDIDRYLQDLALIPVLSQQAEQEVIRQIVDNPHSKEADDARTQLIEAHLPLVVRFARRYQPFGLELTDLVQEGNLALIRAAHYFEPQGEQKFRPFAAQAIHRALSRVVVSHLCENHLFPSNEKTEPIAPLSDQEQKALMCHDMDEQAMVFDLPEERFISLDVLLAEADTDSFLPDDRSTCHACCYEGNRMLLPDESVLTQERDSLMTTCLQQLPKRERLVLIHRYLLGTAPALEEVARTLHITRKLAWEIERQALRRLRHSQLHSLLS